MLGVSENSACIFHIKWNESSSAKVKTISKDRLKRHISLFLEMGFEEFFHRHLLNCIGKLKMITWN